MIRRLHEAPLPPWPGRALADVEAELEQECEWLLEHSALPTEVVLHNREIARGGLRAWHPSFIHGDLQIIHVFVEDDEVTGIIEWSEGAPGDAMSGLAILTLGHEERLEDLLADCGTRAPHEVPIPTAPSQSRRREHLPPVSLIP